MNTSYNLHIDGRRWVCKVSDKSIYPRVSIDFYDATGLGILFNPDYAYPSLHCVEDTDNLMKQYSSGEEAVRGILENALEKSKEIELQRERRKAFWS